MVGCVCLHGFGENREVYSIFAAEMSKIMPTITVDLMGHGKNRRDEYNISDIIPNLNSILEDSMMDEIILVGTSFGGIVSYIFSSSKQNDFPQMRDRIVGLIINDVPCCIPRTSFQTLQNNLLFLSGKNYNNLTDLDADYRSIGFKLDREPISDENWRHFLESSVENGKVNYDPNFINLVIAQDHGIATIADEIAFRVMPDGSEALDLRYYWSAIQKPMLLFRGERTTFFPEYVRDFMSSHPFLKTIEVPNGGHFIDLSRDEVMNEISTWYSHVKSMHNTKLARS